MVKQTKWGECHPRIFPPIPVVMLIKVYFYFLLSKIIVKHILHLIPIDCSEHYPWNSKIILAKTTKNSFQCIKLISDPLLVSFTTHYLNLSQVMFISVHFTFSS